MNQTRQKTLTDRLSAMFRMLPGIVASVLVFSIAFFNPLIDVKDTDSAFAQSRDDRGGRGDRGSDRDDRGSGGNSGSSKSGGGGGGSDRSNDRGGNSGNSGNSASRDSASQKPGSGGLLNRVFRDERFNGNSEQSGGSLSEREEREAIQNGWQ
ncbi:hypothetical protein FIV00_02035 [Labrenzia sp. THAF82]|uniref:SelK/SelG family selenoprotein n=1 Tax=Labrenzia sp. THAF82 TaxID=2587861 RepID=UPI001268D96C|nr:SelK/SelG family selenoprotein [Labrenzia sp. THAF82]QFT29254.1 hypothetical protein FIV00_02035 [Labrenzia sp. THAF82]